jgi:hypothetical protein
MGLRTSSREYGLPRDPSSVPTEIFYGNLLFQEEVRKLYNNYTFYYLNWHALQLSCGTQRHPAMNGFPPSSIGAATTILSKTNCFMYRVFRRMYEFPSRIFFNPGLPLRNLCAS